MNELVVAAEAWKQRNSPTSLRAAYLAGAAEALERAAKVAEQMLESNKIAKQIADAIRRVGERDGRD